MGKTPILVTSLVRRIFDASGKIKSTQTPYVEAVRALAREDDVALVDLFASSSALVERQGGAAFVDLSPKTADGAVDTTHLNARGSLVFARLVVDGLRTAAPVLAPVLLRDPARVAWDDVLKQPAAWFGSDEAARIADLLLLYQRDTGGWPKNIDMSAPLAADARTRLLAERVNTDSTIDNGATVTQLRALARIHTARPDDRYRDAFARGLHLCARAERRLAVTSRCAPTTERDHVQRRRNDQRDDAARRSVGQPRRSRSSRRPRAPRPPQRSSADAA